jgi:DNA-binding MarR family transcriptional regulator
MSNNITTASGKVSPHTLEQSYLVLFHFLMLSKRRVFELGAKHDLTGMQTMMLVQLDHSRPMNGFKKIFNCDASNVTGLVDGLEQKSLAARYENADDRRIKMVKLTAKGKRLRATLLRQFTTHNGPILSRLTPDERQHFTQLLLKITSNESHASQQ